MLTEPIHFCLLFRPVDEDRAQYQIHVAENPSVRFDLVTDSIVGMADYRDPTNPIEKFETDRSMILSKVQRHAILGLIRNGVIVAIIKMAMKKGVSSDLVLDLPELVNPLGLNYVFNFVHLHEQQPIQPLRLSPDPKNN